VQGKKQGGVMEKPKVENLEEMLYFLDDLRESGITNMFGGAAFVHENFDVTRQQSCDVLVYWMKTFGERRKNNG
jgi:hypothetical protein